MKYIHYESGDGVAIIRLNRPDKLNALNRALLSELGRALNEAEADDTVNVVILTGVGKAFSVGMDLKEAQNSRSRLESDVRDDFWDPSSLLRPRHDGAGNGYSKVTIAAVNGFAFGGGFYLAQQADLCIASEEATFEISEVRLGLLSGWHVGFMEGLPRRISYELATGARLSSSRLYEVGFLNRTVKHDQLIEAAVLEAQRICSLNRDVVKRNLELAASLRPTVPDHLVRQANRIRNG